MVKLKRLSLNELAKNVSLMTEEEQRACIGGESYIIDIVTGKISLDEENQFGYNFGYDVVYLPGGMYGVTLERGSVDAFLNNQSFSTSDATKLFEFAASYSLSEFMLGNTGNGNSILVRGVVGETEIPLSYLSGVYTELIHSHGAYVDQLSLSDADRYTASLNPNITYKIYYQNSYYEYDENGFK